MFPCSSMLSYQRHSSWWRWSRPGSYLRALTTLRQVDVFMAHPVILGMFFFGNKRCGKRWCTTMIPPKKCLKSIETCWKDTRWVKMSRECWWFGGAFSCALQQGLYIIFLPGSGHRWPLTSYILYIIQLCNSKDLYCQNEKILGADGWCMHVIA